MTRENDSSCLSVGDRKTFAEGKNPALFLSIHANSATTAPSRTEVYAQDAFFTEYTESRKIAEAIVKGVSSSFNTAEGKVNLFSEIYVDGKSRCSSPTNCIAVMTSNKFPSILIEAGYMNNSNDRLNIFNETNQLKAATNIANDLANYFSAEGTVVTDSSNTWHTNVYATRHDFSSELNASGEKCTTIYCVALPDSSALRKTIEVCNTDNTKCKEAYVVDLGPFCVADSAYVNGTARPYAEINKGKIFTKNEGPSCNPRGVSGYPASNGAGIDLSQELANYLGVPGNGNVNWRFV